MKQFLVIALIVLVIVGGIAFYLVDRQSSPEPAVEVPVVQAPPPAAVTPEAEAETGQQAPPPFVVGEKASPGQTQLDELPLPPLKESDDYVRENLESVVGEAATMPSAQPPAASGPTVRLPTDGSKTARPRAPVLVQMSRRSEERRVGKEWRCRWSPYH